MKRKIYTNPGVIRFEAELKPVGGNLSNTYVEFPYDLKQTYGIGNLIPVMVTFDGVEYRGSIAKMGPKPMLLVRKDIGDKLGKVAGDKVKVNVTLDESPRVVEIPIYLLSRLKKEPEAKEKFSNLSYSHQREYVEWANGAKQEETRLRRVEKIIEELKKKI